MVHASLFSGIGGPEVAAAMLGWTNAFHCEINPFGRAVLDYWASATDFVPEEKVAAVTEIYNQLRLAEMSRAIEEQYYSLAKAELEALSVSEENKQVVREFMAALMDRDV